MPHLETVLCAERVEHGNGPAPPGAEAEILPNEYDASGQRGHEDRAHELLRRLLAEGLVESEHECSVNAGRFEQLDLLRVADQCLWAARRVEQLKRVAVERDHRCDEVAFRRSCAQLRENGAVTSVNTIELADRHSAWAETGRHRAQRIEKPHVTPPWPDLRPSAHAGCEAT